MNHTYMRSNNLCAYTTHISVFFVLNVLRDGFGSCLTLIVIVIKVKYTLKLFVCDGSLATRSIVINLVRTINKFRFIQLFIIRVWQLNSQSSFQLRTFNILTRTKNIRRSQ
jgi:hypothetical protein